MHVFPNWLDTGANVLSRGILTISLDIPLDFHPEILLVSLIFFKCLQIG